MKTPTIPPVKIGDTYEINGCTYKVIRRMSIRPPASWELQKIGGDKLIVRTKNQLLLSVLDQIRKNKPTRKNKVINRNARSLQDWRPGK